MAVLLAGVAAVLFAAAAVLQQRGARSEARMVRPASRRVAWQLVKRLAGSPVWLAGSTVDAAGFAVHATALHIGSLAVVQPVLTLTLPASLVLAGARTRSRPSGIDWVGVGLLCGGVVVFLAVTAPNEGPMRSAGALPLATLVTALLAAAFAMLGRDAGPTRRALAWGAAAAIAFGLTAALTKAATADLAAGGVARLLLDWPGWVLPVVAAAGVALQQGAFASGPLAAAMLPITLINPVTATLLGLLAWREHLAGGPFATVLAVLISLALVAAGTAIVSRSALLQRRPRRVW